MEKDGDKEPDALGKAMFEAEHFANRMMKSLGTLPLALFIHTARGVVPLTAVNVSSEEEKAFFARTARLLCAQHAADAAVFVTETSIPAAKKDQGPDSLPSSSLFPDRQEAVALIGETRETHVHKVMSIIRSDNGKFFGFREAPEIRFDNIEGRLTSFLTKEIPDEATQSMAKFLLGGFGNMKL